MVVYKARSPHKVAPYPTLERKRKNKRTKPNDRQT
jgi:hypothetical protein